MIQSAANLIFLCGDERYANEGATFFFYQTYSQVPPGQRITEAFATERLKSIRYDDQRSASIIASKTDRSVESVRQCQNTKLVMDHASAIKHGIIHSVRPLAIPKDAYFHQIVI